MQNYNKVDAELVAKLQEICGSRGVITDEELMFQYSHDETPDSHYNHLPEVVALPTSAAQVAAIMKLANELLVPVVPRGTGTGLACGAVPVLGGIVLSLERMDRIIKVDADNMYMIVEPGVLTAEVQKAARAVGLFYAGDPCSGDSCCIGGNAATNAGGNKAVKYGTTRHQVCAIEVVLPQGDVTVFGGRIAKDTTGYCLDQLILGSEGTLGIITQLTLKLKPLPKYSTDILAVFPDLSSAVDIVCKIIRAGVDPTCVELMDTPTIQSVERFLHEKLPDSDTGNYVIIQIEAATEDELDDKCIQLDELCSANSAMSVLVADSAKIWRARKSFNEAVRSESLVVSKEDAVVPIDQIAVLMEKVAQLREKYGLVTRLASHAGDGNLHLNVLKGDMPDDEWQTKISAFQHELYTEAYRLGGKLSGEHGIGYKRKALLQEFTEPVCLNVMKSIKQALDPKLILNPGKLFDIE